MEYRTHWNGTIGEKDVNKRVLVVGWVSKKRNLGSLLFIDLRDRSGIIQVVANDDLIDKNIRNEYVLQVSGVVTKKDVPNPLLKTGAYEIKADKITILNTAKTSPLIIAD